jgi:hypothetical protein
MISTKEAIPSPDIFDFEGVQSTRGADAAKPAETRCPLSVRMVDRTNHIPERPEKVMLLAGFVVWMRSPSVCTPTSAPLRLPRQDTLLMKMGTPALARHGYTSGGAPIRTDTLPLLRVGTGSEPVIRIVKELWRLSPVASRCLSTAPVLHLEEHFRGKDLDRSSWSETAVAPCGGGLLLNLLIRLRAGYRPERHYKTNFGAWGPGRVISVGRGRRAWS